MTRVSVCMATFNGAPYLREQLDSILSQLHPADELIISDDHSTDDTRAIIESYRDARIRLIVNPGKRGHVRNFAHAMAHATGDFIALSDQDDIWVENRLERMLDQLRLMPRYSLLVGEFTEFGRDQDRTTLRWLGPSPKTGFGTTVSAVYRSGEISWFLYLCVGESWSGLYYRFRTILRHMIFGLL